MLSPTDGGAPNREYPRHPPLVDDRPPEFSTESFVWQFLHVRSEIVGIDRFDCLSRPPNELQTWRDGLARCVSAKPAYPDLAFDPLKHDAEATTDCQVYNPPPVGGLKDWEGILHREGYRPLPPDPGLDTLYTAGPYNWFGSPPSEFKGAVIAQRYESTHADTLHARTQGRAVLFLFQPFYFEESATYEAGSAAINWLMTGSDY